jgi:hypothetical protein
MKGYFRNTKLNTNRNLQAYVIGIAIGDGNLSKPSPRAVRLRITCDKKYPKLINRIAKSLKRLLPENRIQIVDRNTFVDVSIHSNHLESLLGWKANKGPKFIQKVRIPDWIKIDKSYIASCLRGLLETDGSVYLDRGYRMVIFSTINTELANDVLSLFQLIGYKPHIYKIKQQKNRYDIAYKYQIRLSKNVDRFIDLVGIDKS